MNKIIFRSLATTLALIALVFYFSSDYGTGFTACVSFGIWLLYTFVNVFSVAKNKQWWLFAVRFVAWCVLWANLYFIHQNYAYTMREQANQIVQQIEQYHAKHGEYPPRDTLNLPRRMLYWRGNTPETKNEAHLMYRDNVMMFDEHVYDFKTKQWAYRPD